MSTCQLITHSLRKRVLDSVPQLTCRKQVPNNVMSSLFTGGINPHAGPALEDMKQLLVDAFRVFDRTRVTVAEGPAENTHGLSPNHPPQAFANNSATVGIC